MTHLSIQQGTNTEIVSTQLIKKLYETALAVPEPLEGEEDAAYMSGNLQIAKTYRSQVEYLTNRFPDLHISADKYYISFQDPEVNRVLIADGIGDGTGISTDDATNATFSDQLFYGNTTITTFPEFIEFKQGRISSECFRDCTNLTYINIHELKNCDLLAFDHCTSLEIEVDCPLLTYFGWGVFRQSGITKVKNLGYIQTIYQSTFADCKQLTEVVLPSSCTWLQNAAFAACNNLREINIENIAKLGNNVFGWDPGMLVANFANLQQVDEERGGAFVFSESRYMYAPRLTTVGGGFDTGGNNVRGLFCCSGWNNSRTYYELVYFKNLSQVQTGCFCGGTIQRLVINNTQPPQVNLYQYRNNDKLFDDTSFSTHISYIYVPDSTMSAYSSHTYWKEAYDAGKLKPISELSTVATRADWDQLSDENKKETLIAEYM